MPGKSFVAILIIIIITFAAIQLIIHYRAPVGIEVALSKLPMARGEWVGKPEELPQSIVELLSPDDIFAASFINQNGNRVQLFVDYYSPQNTVGSIHSPRNCLPGSGWLIEGSEPRSIEISGHTIRAVRFHLILGQARQVMDFWYITRMGETADDFRLKFNTMISSLVLRPTDKAFVRFVTPNDPSSLAALDEFEQLYIHEIYSCLPFGERR